MGNTKNDKPWWEDILDDFSTTGKGTRLMVFCEQKTSTRSAAELLQGTGLFMGQQENQSIEKGSAKKWPRP